MINVERVPFRSIRVDRLAARRAFYFFLAVLAVVAVYRAVDPPKQIIVERPLEGAPDLPAQLFARDFVSAFLSYDADNPEARSEALSAFGGGDDQTWGYQPPSTGSRTVTETNVEQVYPKGADQDLYVIDAKTTAGNMHLSITIGRAETGELQVVGLPAIVGGVAHGESVDEPDEGVDDVTAEQLKTVVPRALTNWFAHQSTDLAADLGPDATVALPDQTYELGQMAALEDLHDGSVRATVVVSNKAGEQLTLAYDVNVEKRADRWTVSAIETLPLWH